MRSSAAKRANCGDEDFALCKCPHCGRIYLIEYEVDTIYLDPIDLDQALVSTSTCRRLSAGMR